ncbi:ribosomal protein S16 domain-containing protein [Ephemerocybe angulata]|uniref:Ribosomal protein S16 domain-containing protein n=1 Tax=Ephemerocybe angulata TaxID=980116 RepID=A0A8H6IKJ0_9AGAR|nr:ribosomal protein S16 domain-containing protein [Tulosesus angulatus]
MPIRIRMSMHGPTNRRIFHINVLEQTRKRDAKPTELLGIYDPHLDVGQTTKTIQWSVDRIRYWLSVGAKPSTSVVKLLELGGILKPGNPYRPAPKKRTSPTLEAVADAKASKAATSS